MVISPEKSDIVAFLGLDPVRCKIVVGKKCLQKSKNFKYLGYEIAYKNANGIQQKQAKFAQTLGITNSTFKLTLVQKISIIKLYRVRQKYLTIFKLN
jgi:hypothetical protein